MSGKVLDGVILKGNDFIYPMPGSLCMGFSWSLYFCQMINEHQCSLTRSLKDSSIISDKGRPVVFTSQQVKDKPETGTRHYVYVDNLGVLSPHEGIVRSALEEMDGHFGNVGLLLHPGEVSVGRTKALGTILDGTSLCSKITPERFHKVRQAIRGILQKKRVTGQALEVVIGHATFCALNNRMLLSIFHTCYKYIQRHYFTADFLWDSVCTELRAFAGLMIFLRSDWWRPWNNLVCCSDASTTGYGVCTSFWSREDVAAVGRTKERSRFKRSSTHSARETSLTSAGFVRDQITGLWKAGEIDGEEYLEMSGWTLDQSFPEVPARLLQRHLWAPRLWGKWKHKEGILTLEARAAVKALQRVALSVFGSQIRQLFLLDNMSLVLALERCRSRQYGLTKQIRIFCAYCLSRGIQPAFRWLPSELNNADEPSRYDTQEESKLLTSLIGHAAKKNSVPGASNESSPPSAVHVKGAETRKDVDTSESRQQEPSVASQLPSRTTQAANDIASEFSVGDSPCGRSEGRQIRSSFQQLRQQQRWGANVFQTQETSHQGQVQKKKVCRPPDGGERSTAAFSSRTPSRGQNYRKDLRKGIQEFPPICQAQRIESEPSRSSGRAHCAIYEPAVFGRSPSFCRGSSHCKLAPSPPSIQQSWNQADPPLSSRIARMEATLPWKVQSPFPPCSMVWPSCVDDGDGVSSDEHLRHDGPVHLCSSFRVDPLESLQFDPTGHRSDWQLEPSSQSRRVGRSLQDDGLRCKYPLRLALYDLLGFESVWSAEASASTPRSLAVQLQPVPGRFQAMCRQTWSAADPVPCSPQWAIDRSQSQVSIPARSAAAGPMENLQKRGQVREISKIGTELGTDPPTCPRLLSPLRTRLRGHRLRAKEATKLNLPRRNPKGYYIADLFSGSGGVSAACERLGFVSREWDVRLGSQCDLTNRKILNCLKRDIKAGRVLAVMLSPPCESFSVGRDRIRAIRSRDWPWGLPSSLLSEVDRTIVSRGNACFRSCKSLITLLERYHVPWILENPATSKCWFLPFLQHVQAQPHCETVVTDFCQYGTIWKKRTKFLCSNIPCDDLHRLQHICTGKSLCSHSNKPHFQLQGKGPGGKRWTAIAEPYPAQLCDGLAYALTARWHYNAFNYSWHVWWTFLFFKQWLWKWFWRSVKSETSGTFWVPHFFTVGLRFDAGSVNQALESKATTWTSSHETLKIRWEKWALAEICKCKHKKIEGSKNFWMTWIFMTLLWHGAQGTPPYAIAITHPIFGGEVSKVKHLAHFECHTFLR